MFENYEDAVTKYSAEQQKNALSTKKVAIKTDNSNNVVDSSNNENIKKKIDNSNNVIDNSNNTIVPKIDNVGDNLTNLFNTIFNKSNIILIIWFLGIYFVAYFGAGMFFNKGDETTSSNSNFDLNLSRTLDMLFLASILIVMIAVYYSYDQTEQQNVLGGVVTNTTSFIDNPVSIFTVALFLIVLYAVTNLFRIPMTAETKPLFISFIENVAWVFLVIIAFVDFFKYILGISLIDLFSKMNYWSKLPDAPPKIDSSNNKIDNSNNKIDSSLNRLPVQLDEVFNISNNIYTYDDAQSVCAAYSSKLATYDQIENAYLNGGEWCNYGWSSDQMAYFPTQKATWNKLQKDGKHKNDCGRPGVNGGYMANPKLKFGVNCYGKKPPPSADDLARLTAKQNVVRPKTEEDLALEKKIKYWKDNADKLLKINSYNTKSWSAY